MAQLKGTTSELIGRFCVAAEAARPLSATDDGPLRRYEAELIVPGVRPGRVRCAQGDHRAVRDAATGCT